MIIDFKRQTCASIAAFLRDMGSRRRTYSAHLTGLYPFGPESHFYVYATKREVVVVAIDTTPEGTREIACEECSLWETPHYSRPGDSRTSPVRNLKTMMNTFEEHLYKTWGKERPRLWGVLLSNATFINKADLLSCWHSMLISVFDRQTSIEALLHLPVNTNEQLFGSQYLLNYKLHIVPPAIEPLDDEFERMLEEFISREFDELHGASLADDTDDDDTDDDIDDDAADSDSADADAADADELLSTFGQFELGSNNTVKVEVLQPMHHPERELEKLVGCQNIKKHIAELIVLNQYNTTMQSLDPTAKTHELSLHSIFFGRPGTGKTTVCKIMGSLLHNAGMLSRGHVVVASRSTFIGSNWGDEERAVRQVVDMACGGVLMIDEAYLLNGDNRNDPGKMVLPMLMDILANEQQRDLAIVLCGYKQPMLRLLELNPGLESRFPNRFEFEDFSVDELLDITRQRIGEHSYTFSPQAWDAYTAIVNDAYQQRDPQTWGNARFIANQLERIYIAHAQRCVKAGISDRDAFFCITPADIQPIEVPHPRRRIGF